MDLYLYWAPLFKHKNTRCTRAWAYVQMLGTCIECHGSISDAFRVAFNCHRISFECHWLASHVIRDIRWHWMPCDVWGHSDTIQWHVKDVRRHWMASDGSQWHSEGIRWRSSVIWQHLKDIPWHAMLFSNIRMIADDSRMPFDEIQKTFKRHAWHSMQVA